VRTRLDFESSPVIHPRSGVVVSSRGCISSSREGMSPTSMPEIILPILCGVGSTNNALTEAYERATLRKSPMTLGMPTNRSPSTFVIFGIEFTAGVVIVISYLILLWLWPTIQVEEIGVTKW